MTACPRFSSYAVSAHSDPDRHPGGPITGLAADVTTRRQEFFTVDVSLRTRLPDGLEWRRRSIKQQSALSQLWQGRNPNNGKESKIQSTRGSSYAQNLPSLSPRCRANKRCCCVSTCRSAVASPTLHRAALLSSNQHPEGKSWKPEENTQEFASLRAQRWDS